MDKHPHFTIGELCNIEKGVTGIASAIPGAYPLVNTSADRKSCNTFQFDTEAVCIPLVSSTGHGKKSLNYIHYQKGKFALGTILAAVIPKEPKKLSAAFLHRYLQFNKDRIIVPLMKGAANVSLAVKDIAKILIPVPPINEQSSFIELFNKLNYSSIMLRNEFSTQSSILTKLRQSILQEAIEGKLTAEWRKYNPVKKGDPDYDAIALLEKIKAEKQKMIAERMMKKEKLLTQTKLEEVPFELPNGWVWCRLGAFTQIKGGKRVSNGYKLLKTPTPFIYIRVTDMKNGTIDDTDIHYIDETMHNKIKQYIITKEDLYMTIVGATIGKCGIVPEKFDKMNLTENAARIILHQVNKEYLIKCLTSQFCQLQFIDKTKQVAVQKMALNRFETSLIPLPPLAEQHAIVSRVETLLAMVDELEKQVGGQKKQAEELMQTVLREAFEGGR
ncbi:MAG: restriction endonuclease subunit S [Chlorobium sp.]|nr:restriction endonuclease subunit S [Chlorobium sp.]